MKTPIDHLRGIVAKRQAHLDKARATAENMAKAAKAVREAAAAAKGEGV